MRRRWLLPCVASAVTFLVFLASMGYPWQLALLIATAIGAFAYSLEGTWTRLRRLYSRPRPGIEFIETDSAESTAAESTTAESTASEA